MESLDQVACENLCRDNSSYPTIVGAMLAAIITFVLALCLGYF